MGVQFILQAWCKQYAGLLQTDRVIFDNKAWGEYVKLICGGTNWFSSSDCNSLSKRHFDQKYFLKIHFVLKCNSLLFLKL